MGRRGEKGSICVHKDGRTKRAQEKKRVIVKRKRNGAVMDLFSRGEEGGFDHREDGVL